MIGTIIGTIIGLLVMLLVYLGLGIAIHTFFNYAVECSVSMKKCVAVWPVIIVLFTCRLVIEWIVGGVRHG